MADDDVGWPIVLKKGSDFWQEELDVFDDFGGLVPLSDATLTIYPDDGSTPVVWSVLNGKIIIATGLIKFEVPKEDIAAFTWKHGHYCLAITYSDGHDDGSLLSHTVEVVENCPSS